MKFVALENCIMMCNNYTIIKYATCPACDIQYKINTRTRKKQSTLLSESRCLCDEIQVHYKMTSVVPRTASTLRSRVRTLAISAGEPLKGFATSSADTRKSCMSTIWYTSMKKVSKR